MEKEDLIKIIADEIVKVEKARNKTFASQEVAQFSIAISNLYIALSNLVK